MKKTVMLHSFEDVVAEHKAGTVIETLVLR